MNGVTFNQVDIGYMFNRSSSSRIPRIGPLLWHKGTVSYMLRSALRLLVDGAAGSGYHYPILGERSNLLARWSLPIQA